jgi:hypothetical protein
VTYQGETLLNNEYTVKNEGKEYTIGPVWEWTPVSEWILVEGG